MTALGDLQALAEEYLALCVAALATTPDGAPDRAFVSPGPPSWDCCPQLSVHVGGPVIADTAPTGPAVAAGHRIALESTLDLIALTATILRCGPDLPEDGFPDAAEIGACAVQTNADVWAVWNHLRSGKSAGTLWPPKERELYLDPASALQQSGGCAGWQVPVRVQLSGYTPA